MFALVLKTIFDGQKSTPSTPNNCSFLSNRNEKPKAIHVKVKASQDLLIVSAICVIISSLGFRKLYNDDITFVPQYEYSQNSRQQTRIIKAVSIYK